MKVFSRSKGKYTVHGEDRYTYEIHLFGLTFLVYTKTKHCEKRIRVDRDKFLGTGTTICVFLPF